MNSLCILGRSLTLVLPGTVFKTRNLKENKGMGYTGGFGYGVRENDVITISKDSVHSGACL